MGQGKEKLYVLGSIIRKLLLTEIPRRINSTNISSQGLMILTILS